MICAASCLLLAGVVLTAEPPSPAPEDARGGRASTAELAVGRTLLLAGRAEEARRVFDVLRRRYPASPEAYFGLLEGLMKLKQYEACTGLLAECPWPESLAARRVRAAVFMATGREDEARELLEGCIVESGRGTGSDLLDLAENERLRGRWDRSLRLYQEFLSRDVLAAEERPDVKANLDTILVEHKPRLSISGDHIIQARTARISHITSEVTRHCDWDLRFRGQVRETIGHRRAGGVLLRPINETISGARAGFSWEPRPRFRAEAGIGGYADGLSVVSGYGLVRWEPAERTAVTLSGDLFRLNADVVDFLAVEGTYHELGLEVRQEFARFGFARARGALRRYQYAGTKSFGSSGAVETGTGLVLRLPQVTATAGYVFHFFDADLEEDLSLGDFDPLFTRTATEAERRAYLGGALVPEKVTTHGVTVELSGQTGWRQLEWHLQGGYSYDLVPGTDYWNVGGGLVFHPTKTVSVSARYNYWSSDPKKGGGATTEVGMELAWWF